MPFVPFSEKTHSERYLHLRPTATVQHPSAGGGWGSHWLNATVLATGVAARVSA